MATSLQLAFQFTNLFENPLQIAANLIPMQPSAAPTISISSDGNGSDTLLPPLAASLNGSSPQLAPASPPSLQGLGESGVLQGAPSSSSQSWDYSIPQGVIRPQSNDTLAFFTVSSAFLKPAEQMEH